MELDKLKFPMYDDTETQSEYIVYNYLSLILGNRGYILKVKKTNYPSIDDNIVSKTGKSIGACDAYVFSQNACKHLYALVELESTGNLCKKNMGIDQVRNYAIGLRNALNDKRYETNCPQPYIIAYDGNKLWVSQYNLLNGSEVVLIGTEKDGTEMTDTVKEKFIGLFKEKEKVEIVEKSLISKTKHILSQNRNLQVNKAFILTVLASIYGDTKKDEFDTALQTLQSYTAAGKEDSKTILSKWESIDKKIEYSGDMKIKEIIKRLYNEVAIKLFVISQDKQLDLYGYIYEELSEKNNKKDDGEYYTPRSHIRAIINSVVHNYLFNQWRLTNNKEDSLSKLYKKKIVDPFCGSGGFIYIFLKLIKEKYELSKDELNELSKNSICAIDKNDITTAYFNLFLVGDGEGTIKQVMTSINWQNAWKFDISLNENNGKTKIIKIDNNSLLIRNIEQFTSTFMIMLDNLVNMDYVNQKFPLKNLYKSVNSIKKFIEKYESEMKKTNSEFIFFSELMNKEYLKENKPIFKLMYETFKSCSQNVKNVIEYEEFVKNLGNVDFIATNVPYGTLNDNRYKGEIGNRLESQALIECINLLKPSSSKICEDNGKLISNNDGGVATVIIPGGIFERDDFMLREYLLKRCKILSLLKLPLHTFSPYAQVQTYVITFRKKAIFEYDYLEQNQEVFMYIIDNDGKANSEKRFETRLINEARTEIVDKNGKLVTSLHEYIHDDINVNIEKYPEGYFSKLERAWIFGKLSEMVSFDWNQIRYNQNWNGTTWEKEEGKKWGFMKLTQKKCERQIEKRKITIKNIINQLVSNDNDFIECSIEDKKSIIIEEIKKQHVDSVISNIKEIQVNESTIKVISNVGVEIKNKNLKNFLCNLYKGQNIIIKSDQKEFDELKIMIFEGINYPKEVLDEIEYVNDEIDNIIVTNAEVKLLKTEQYQEYDLLADNYLLPQIKITKEYILENFARLQRMKNNLNYNMFDVYKKVDNIVTELRDINQSNYVLLKEFISINYVERGDRLTQSEMYNNYGKYPVYSSTTTGPYGFYKKSNCKSNSRSLIYTIEGKAGYVLIPVCEEIYLTDVAGMIEIIEDYALRFNMTAISLYLQYLFINNRHNTGQQPKFLIKKNLNMKIDLNVIEVLSKLFPQESYEVAQGLKKRGYYYYSLIQLKRIDESFIYYSEVNSLIKELIPLVKEELIKKADDYFNNQNIEDAILTLNKIIKYIDNDKDLIDKKIKYIRELITMREYYEALIYLRQIEILEEANQEIKNLIDSILLSAKADQVKKAEYYFNEQDIKNALKIVNEALNYCYNDSELLALKLKYVETVNM